MFIDVGEGISISSKHIEAIETLNELSCIVHTTTKSFEVYMPREVLLTFIESKDKSSSGMSNVEKLLTKIYSQQDSGAATPRP